MYGVRGHRCHSACVEIRGQLAGLGSFFLPCGSEIKLKPTTTPTLLLFSETGSHVQAGLELVLSFLFCFVCFCLVCLRQGLFVEIWLSGTCSVDWPRTHRDLPVSASRVLGYLSICATPPTPTTNEVTFYSLSNPRNVDIELIL